MTADAWVVVGLCAVSTATIKGIGPFALGGRPLPAAATRVIALLAPALLAALVVTGVFSENGHLHLGDEAVGVLAGGAAALRDASILVCVVLAAVVTAALRALT